MNIFYKCSFKSSNGYKVAKCSTDSYSLILLDESKKENNEEISKTIMTTLNYSLGRSMVLATDENGDYFLGVYNLVEGDSEKCVNVIFSDSDYMKILKIFIFLCKHYQEGKSTILKTITRISPREDGLEYMVVSEEVDRLIQAGEEESFTTESYSKPRKVIAFITEDNYEDYCEKLVRNCMFDVKGTVVMEQENSDAEKINLQLKSAEQQKTIIPIFIIVVILLVLFFILR